MPSHQNIIDDLMIKKQSDGIEYEKLRALLTRLFECKYVCRRDII